MKKLLWLDDYRDPFEFLPDGETMWIIFSPIEPPFETYWVKSYNEFTEWINLNGLPNAICFDHDLGDYQALHSAGYIDEELPKYEKTGYDCAKWLVEYCLNNNLNLPLYNIQSANPVGKTNIDELLKSFNKYKSNS